MKRKLLGLKMMLAIILTAGCRSGEDIAPTESAGGVLSGVPALSELAGTPATEVPPLPVLDVGEIAIGQELYAIHCGSCHGAELAGEADWQTPNEDGTFRAPPHDASGHTWHHGDQTLLEAIRLGGGRLPQSIGGRSEMPAFAGILNEEQRVAILTYIKSTWPEDIRLVQWERTTREP